VAEDGYAGDNGVGGRYAARVELPRTYQVRMWRTPNLAMNRKVIGTGTGGFIGIFLPFLFLCRCSRKWVVPYSSGMAAQCLRRTCVWDGSLAVFEGYFQVPRSESAPRLQEHFPSNPFLCSVSP
jgi:hypothetical protein